MSVLEWPRFEGATPTIDLNALTTPRAQRP
ncbi:MAG: hypothetical protein QOI78_8628 [Actinomycetota bacterium]|jgi:hypothetical protein|nr:hypothetical protein [Actinomycetota bacterium]